MISLCSNIIILFGPYGRVEDKGDEEEEPKNTEDCKGSEKKAAENCI